MLEGGWEYIARFRETSDLEITIYKCQKSSGADTGHCRLDRRELEANRADSIDPKL